MNSITLQMYLYHKTTTIREPLVISPGFSTERAHCGGSRHGIRPAPKRTSTDLQPAGWLAMQSQTFTFPFRTMPRIWSISCIRARIRFSHSALS